MVQWPVLAVPEWVAWLLFGVALMCVLVLVASVVRLVDSFAEYVEYVAYKNKCKGEEYARRCRKCDARDSDAQRK